MVPGAVFIYLHSSVFTHQEFNKSFAFVTQHFIIQRRREGMKIPQAMTHFLNYLTQANNAHAVESNTTDVIMMSYVPIKVVVLRGPPAAFWVVLHPNAHLSFSHTEDLITKQTIVAI